MMKISEIYKKAQFAVLKDATIPNGEKFEILAELIEQEDRAKYREKAEAAV